MSVLERRLQVLLDQAQYDRLKAEADASGRSVGAVVRGAIDEHLSQHDVQARADAARRLLARAAAAAPGTEGEWPDMKRALEDDLVKTLP